MNLFKKIVIVLIICGAVSIIFLTWYSGQHSREEILPTPAQNEQPVLRILVAADHVEVKDSLIRKVIQGLEAEQVTIEVYNLSDLSEILQSEWAAMVVFQKAGSLPEGSDRVSQIKSFANGFLVTFRGNNNYILEGGGILTPTSVSGVEPAAIQIVTKVQRVLDQAN
jgi:hypothetical protein